MDLSYLAGSLGGVAALVALCAILFGMKGARITAARDLEVYLTQISPAFRLRSVALAKDGMVALAENDADGAIHLVVTRGDTFVTRILSPTLLRTVTRDGTTLSLHLSDFTLPNAKLAFGDPTAAVVWEKKLLGMTH